jgi:hypothetical protein
MVKIHLFSGFASERLGISRDTQLGHLYSDQDNEELMQAARVVGINPRYIQNSRGFWHFDLWGQPLQKARQMFKTVTNREIYQDLKAAGRCREDSGTGLF